MFFDPGDVDDDVWQKLESEMLGQGSPSTSPPPAAAPQTQASVRPIARGSIGAHLRNARIEG